MTFKLRVFGRPGWGGSMVVVQMGGMLGVFGGDGMEEENEVKSGVC